MRNRDVERDGEWRNFRYAPELSGRRLWVQSSWVYELSLSYSSRLQGSIRVTSGALDETDELKGHPGVSLLISPL